MKKLILGVFVLSLFSCTPQENKQTNAPIYFDIAGYFANEVVRLQKINPTVSKEVLAKGEVEKKSVKITDWKMELEGFSNADINKASWKGEFTALTSNNSVSYTTNNPKIPIKKIEVLKKDDKVMSVKIIKSTENALYTSADTLLYYPDSLYFILSEQKIKLLSNKKYRVTGKIN